MFGQYDTLLMHELNSILARRIFNGGDSFGGLHLRRYYVAIMQCFMAAAVLVVFSVVLERMIINELCTDLETVSGPSS